MDRPGIELLIPALLRLMFKEIISGIIDLKSITKQIHT